MLVFFIVQEGLIFIVITNLLFFHIYLYFKGYSTYEFIILRREKKKRKKKNKKSKIDNFYGICSEKNVFEKNNIKDLESNNTHELRGSLRENSPSRSSKYKDKKLVVSSSKGKSKIGIKLQASKNQNSGSSIPSLNNCSSLSQIKAKYKAKYKQKYQEKYLKKVKMLRATLNLKEEVKENTPSAPQNLEKPKPATRTLDVSYSRENMPRKMLSDQILNKDTGDPIHTATSQNGNNGEKFEFSSFK